MTTTTTSLHIQPTTVPPAAGVSTYPNRGPIAWVELDDRAISICATAPAHLTAIADAFTDAARQLAQQLDVEAARALNAAQVSA